MTYDIAARWAMENVSARPASASRPHPPRDSELNERADRTIERPRAIHLPP